MSVDVAKILSFFDITKFFGTFFLKNLIFLGCLFVVWLKQVECAACVPKCQTERCVVFNHHIHSLNQYCDYRTDYRYAKDNNEKNQ